MEFKPEITIKGKVFNYVDVQRDKITAIYKDDSTYLRVGDPDKIKKHLEFHYKMQSYDFPVPKIFDEGTVDGMSYFIEDSMGIEHFGNIFKNEVKQFGKIQDESFDQFVNISAKFAEAQLKTITLEKDWKTFSIGIQFETLCEELPECKENLLNAYEKVKERLSAFPFVITHGDYTPFNVYPKGVIDFEDSFMGPAGYDLAAVIEHLNWFPESTDYEYFKYYNFTPEQKKIFSDKIDGVYLKNNLPKISEYLTDFDFAKGVWFAVKMERTPKLQEFRYSIIKDLIK